MAVVATPASESMERALESLLEAQARTLQLQEQTLQVLRALLERELPEVVVRPTMEPEVVVNVPEAQPVLQADVRVPEIRMPAPTVVMSDENAPNRADITWNDGQTARVVFSKD